MLPFMVNEDVYIKQFFTRWLNLAVHGKFCSPQLTVLRVTSKTVPRYFPLFNTSNVHRYRPRVSPTINQL